MGSTELFDHLARRERDYDLVCFAPYLFGTTLGGVPLVPGRAVLIPCLHDEPFAHLGVVRAAFQASRGFIFNSPPEAALADKLYGIGDRPAGVVGPRLRSAAARRSRGVPSAPRPRGTAPRLPRPEGDGQERAPPDRVRAPLPRPPPRGPHAGPRRRRTGHRAARHPGGSRSRLPRRLAAKAAAYAAAAVVCQPSVNESFSIVLMEAWLAGTPVLVHARCSVTTHHVFRAGGGLAFEDFYEFAEALDLLLEDGERRRRLGSQGRAYVETVYSWPAVTARLRETLERLVA